MENFKISGFKLKAFFVVAGLLIAFLGYNLRLYQFNFFPPPNDTYDELKGVFNGVSLIKTGVPRSWSWFEPYGDFPVVHIRNADYRIVEPWFEEPPLFGLVAGTYAISKGMDSLEKIDTGAMRWPMLKLATLNIFLLFVLIYLLRGGLEALLAALIFATVPTFVLGSRLPISENMITTAMLLSLIMLVISIKIKQSHPRWNTLFLVLTGLIGASAVLMKTTGIFVPAALIILVFALKRFKAGLIFLGCLIFALSIWFIYGYYYDWDLFVKMIFAQSGRELFTPSTIINLFGVFRIAETAMSPDGWIIWGWISVVAYSLFSQKEDSALAKLILPVMIGSYLVFFSIMSGHSKGWYRFPFYPLLSWAVAAFFIQIIKNPRFLLTFFFISIPFFSSYIYGNGENKWNLGQIKWFQFLLVGFMIPPMLYETYRDKKSKTITQIILIAACVLAIIYNIRTIFIYQDQFWY